MHVGRHGRRKSLEGRRKGRAGAKRSASRPARPSACVADGTLAGVSADLRVIAQTRVDEAKALLAAGLPSGAYYLAGYAVEAGLKAVIVKNWQTSLTGCALPPKGDLDKTYVHNLEKLVGVSGLQADLETETSTNAAFKKYWLVVKDWNESTRYETWTTSDAQDLITAIDDGNNGVLQWLKTHW